MKSVEADGVVGSYSAAEEKGCPTRVGIKQAPVELVATAAGERGAGVEEEVVNGLLEGFGGVYVLVRSDGKGFDDGDGMGVAKCVPEVTAESGRLVAVKLDDVKAKLFYLLSDGCERCIDEDTDTSDRRREVGWRFTDVAAGAFPKDEAHPVDAESFDFANVVRIAHATNLSD